MHKRQHFTRKKLLLPCIILAIVAFSVGTIIAYSSHPTQTKVPFFAAIDTMKASRDTQTHPLSTSEITNIVHLAANLNTNYITVDTNWDYPDYMAQWIKIIRSTGRHVWFRAHPNQWENDNNVTGIMTPAAYEAYERAFILSHPSFFQRGDIFDPCSEPEQGHYWYAQYHAHWTYSAPNTASRDYNAFLRNTTDEANDAFHAKGIYGVITTIRSINIFFASHPTVLEQATIHKLGYITIDSYPDESITTPAKAAAAFVQEFETIEALWHLPIIVGEMGYSNKINVDDTTQKEVLKAELDAIARLPYIAGVNYWVGPGTETSGGYTHIFSQSTNGWTLRPAAYELSAFYKTKVMQV